MKTRSRLVVLALALTLALGFSTTAAFADDGETMVDTAGNQFVANDPVGTSAVTGDLYWAGNLLNLGGVSVNQDVIAAGSNLKVDGSTIAGSLRTASQALDVRNAAIAGNITSAGQTLSVASGTSANGVYLAGQTIDFAGTCNALFVGADSVMLDGVVNGDATIDANNVTIGANAVVTGTLNVTASSEPSVASGATIGTLSYTPSASSEETKSAVADPSPAVGAFAVIGGLLFAIACGFVTIALLLWLLPSTLPFARQQLKARPAPLLLSGLVVVVVSIPALIMLCCLVVTLPVAGLFALLMTVATLIAVPFTFASLAGLALPNMNRWGSAILGVIVGAILSIIPIVGFIAFFFAMMYVLGAICQWWYTGNQARKAAKAQAQQFASQAGQPYMPQPPVGMPTQPMPNSAQPQAPVQPQEAAAPQAPQDTEPMAKDQQQ